MRLNQLASVVALGLFVATRAAAQQPAAPAVSDAEIAAIVVAANTIDAEAGDLAVRRGSTEAVRGFGKLMAVAHRAVNAQAVALVTRLHVNPLEGVVSRKLQADASAFQVQLKKKSGAAFDRAYIENEIAYHKAVIDAVDKLLIPNAVNAELRKTLVDVRPSFVAHLQHAEQILATLK